MKTINETELAGPVASARAYTLIELLTVIAIIAALAAMIFPVLNVVKKKEYINAASAEFRGLQHALEDYHAKYNTYPPSNPSLPPGVNTLYYELTGVSSANGSFSTLDGVTTIPATDYQAAFSAGGMTIGAVINCTQGGDEGASAKNYLSGALKANRFGTITYNSINITNLITSVGGPDASFNPLGLPAGYPMVNPFCYNFPGTNNPGSYDLWIDLKISGKTNRICNWKSAPFTL